LLQVVVDEEALVGLVVVIEIPQGTPPAAAAAAPAEDPAGVAAEAEAGEVEVAATVAAMAAEVAPVDEDSQIVEDGHKCTILQFI
jgi:uncharacterized protein (DUF2252 family)